MVILQVNGSAHPVELDSDVPLLWVLREELGLTGTKYGCGVAQCGACTVLLDGRAMRSCAAPAAGLEGRSIITIEGASGKGSPTPGGAAPVGTICTSTAGRAADRPRRRECAISPHRAARA